MLLTYFLNDFEIVPVAPIITGITLAFTFHMCCISSRIAAVRLHLLGFVDCSVSSSLSHE
jgi:hypothetical protein